MGHGGQAWLAEGITETEGSADMCISRAMLRTASGRVFHAISSPEGITAWSGRSSLSDMRAACYVAEHAVNRVEGLFVREICGSGCN